MRVSIATKYPAGLVVIIGITAVAIASILLNVTIRSLSDEIRKRGVAIAEGFASANTTVMLNRDRSTLQLNINNLARSPDVLDAFLVDHRGEVVGARDPRDIGTLYDLDPASGAIRTAAGQPLPPGPFRFFAPMRYGGVLLGSFSLTISRQPLLSAARQARERVTIVAVGTALALSLLLFFLLRRTLRPVRWMSSALTEIARGNFSQRLTLKRNDELGDLAQAFNAMTSRAELFFLYVDRSIVERLIADPALARPGGKLRELAVLFGDMRGYTSMSNRRSANEVVNIINTYFYLFIEVVVEFGGVVDKTMGDAIMSLFERHDDDADPEQYKQRAVLAATHMKAASMVLNNFLRQRVRKGEAFVQEARDFGFAVAAGKAIVGNIGSPRRMDYTVCGRIVNLAARLESETKRGEVIMDNFCRMGCDQLVNYESLPAVQPKGFTQAERVIPHRVLSLNDEEMDHLRERLEKLYTLQWVRDYLTPAAVHEINREQWAVEAWHELQALIYTTPPEEMFALSTPEATL